MDLTRPVFAEDWRLAGLAQYWDYQGKPGLRLIPETAAQAAEMLMRVGENGLRIAMDPHEAGMRETPVWLDLSRLTSVRFSTADDFMIQVETGMSFGELSRILAAGGQAFPLSYPPDMTIGGILAEDDAALESGLRGYPRDYVLKTETAGADGHVSISGADVVKNVAGYDLAKLYVGGHHAFGVMTSVTLRLAALPACRCFLLYAPDSPYATFALAEKILATNPPISICEIFREGTDCQLLIGMEGSADVVKSALSPLGRLSAGPPELLNEADARPLLSRLMMRTNDMTLLELAFLPSGWQEPAASLLKQSALSGMRFQVRPAAGLIRISAPFFPLSAFSYLREETLRHGGFSRILQISRTDAALASQAQELLETFNLPSDPTIRGLLGKLKTVYDPHGVLFTPRLPLQPMAPDT